jgi:hypothetical protein
MQADLLAKLEQQLAAANARVQQLESTVAACKAAGVIKPDGQLETNCLNCGLWWDRVGQCYQCYLTHEQSVAALNRRAAEAARGGNKA